MMRRHIKETLWIWVVTIELVTFIGYTAPADTPLLATRDAVGPGRYATGGRGGTVLIVSNLNDSGSGSFRQAVEVTASTRIVVFAVGGTITLSSPINIDDGNLTVIGETAPGGILITGDFIRIRAPNIIITGLRLRPGDDVGGAHSLPSERDALFIQEDADNLFVQHCSLSGGTDMNINLWASPGPGSDLVTLQDIFAGESYHSNCHPNFANSGHAKFMDITRAGDVGVYNLYGHSVGWDRTPQLFGIASPASRTEIKNLIVYNKVNHGATIDGPGYYSLEGVMFVDGPNQASNKWPIVIDSSGAGSMEPTALYVESSTGRNRLTDVGDPWYPATGGRYVFGPKAFNNATNGWINFYSSSPPFNWSSGYRARAPGKEALDHAFRWAGAIIPARDATDLRWIAEHRAGTGAIPNGTQVRTLYHPDGTLIAPFTSTTATFALAADQAGTNRYNGLVIEITGGLGVGQSKTISATSGTTTVTVTVPAWTTTPDATSTFRIHQTIQAPVAAITPIATTAALTDADAGGIPDYYEELLGLDPADIADDSALADDGRNNVEHWRDLLYDLTIAEW